MVEKRYKLSQLLRRTTVNVARLGSEDPLISTVRTLSEAGPTDLALAHGKHLTQVEETRAGAVVTDAREDQLSELSNFDRVAWVVTDRPRLAVAQIAGAFARTEVRGVHASAFVDGTASVGADVAIGPLASVGPHVRIGRGTRIGPGVHVHEGVEIGRSVGIGAGTVIGSDGFGYERDEDDWVKVPHLGSVIIEDFVEIGANSCIDRGTFGDTVIERGARIDNLVHVAHNVRVGRAAMVIALAMLGGSVQVGKDAWIAPSSSIINGARIGVGATVGLGAVVLGDVAPGVVVAGVPAKVLRESRG